MTWAERVGDLATNIALVGINLARIFTLAASILATKIDDLVTSLGERGEAGLGRTNAASGTWVSLPAAVLWGIAAIALRLVSIGTVFLRQATGAADDFFRTLAEG
ncbi:MAG: hypothetical protein F4X76_09435 [Chloroflexi bacterium]|nr:hypothetical protein [Chloroflexota bacterium]